MSNEPTIQTMLSLDRQRTAIVLIDLQKGILSMPLAPHNAATVVSNGVALATRCRTLGIPVVLVRVAFRSDNADRLSGPTDAPPRSPLNDPEAITLAPELTANANDILINKHQWGAFYGTDLDLQLRRRGIDTILLGGVATNFGVESTGRDAWERNYQIIFVEDAMSSVSAEAHGFATSVIFPRIGRVRTSATVLASLALLP